MNLAQKNMITAETIYADLCYKIEHLVYEPGQEISEKELCEQYGASRHMVRQALARLKERKLVEIYPQRGSYISLIDLDYISDILFIREAVEQEAVRKLVQMDDIKPLYLELQNNIRKQEDALMGTVTPTDEFFELDHEFHALLQKYAGVSSGIMEIISDPYIHFRRWRNLELRHTMRSKEVLAQHRKMLDKIVAKDAEGARECIHNHINSTPYYNSFADKGQTKYFANR